MNRTKKIVIISVLPILLTLIFIFNVVAPTLGKFQEVKGELESKKTTYQETQTKVNLVREDKKTVKQVKELKSKLADFDIRVPSEDELAILLVDLEKFASLSKVKIFTVKIKPEKGLEIAVTNQIAEKSNKKDSKAEKGKKTKDDKESKNSVKSKKRKKGQDLPVQLSSIPLEISVIGYYPNVLNFVKALESYQRQITIDGVQLANYGEDIDTSNPRVEMVINCAVYKLIEKQVSPDETSKSPESKNEGK